MLLKGRGDACFLFLVPVRAEVAEEPDTAMPPVNQIFALLVTGIQEAEPYTVVIVGRRIADIQNQCGDVLMDKGDVLRVKSAYKNNPVELEAFI
ncbi:hypothetical protein D3C73_1298390 [compost metagenome]